MKSEATINSSAIKNAVRGMPSNGGLHRFVKLIADSLNVPSALISLVDEAGTWFFAHHNFCEKPLNTLIASLEVKKIPSSLTIIPDRHDQPDSVGPILAHLSEWRFSAVYPLRLSNGFLLGCVILLDRQARYDFTKSKAELFSHFIDAIIEHIEMTSQAHIIGDRKVREIETSTEKACPNLLQDVKRNRAVFDLIEDGIAICDVNRRLVFVNAATQKLISLPDIPVPFDEWTRDILIFYKDARTLVPREDIPLIRALRGEYVEDVELVVKQANGEASRLKVQARPIRDHNLIIVGAVASMHNITLIEAAEQKYRYLYNNTPAMIFTVDNGGFIIQVSDYWLEVLEYTRDEVVGRHITQFMKESNSASTVKRMLNSFCYSGKSENVPYQFVKKNGRMMDVLLSSSAIRDFQGNVVKSLSVMVDVTKVKHLEEAYYRSELQFKSAFEAAPQGMALRSIDGKFIMVNQSLCDLLGYEKDELMMTSFQSLTHSDDLMKEFYYIDRLLKQKAQHFQIEKRYQHKSGHYIWTELSIALVTNSQGVPLHFVTQVVDLTSKKEKEALVVQNKKFDAIGQLSVGLAHDFNNVLSVVMGNIELIERSPLLDSKQRRRLASAMKAAQSGADLTQRLLAFSRKQLLEPKHVDVNEFLENIYELAHRTISKEIDLVILPLEGASHAYIDPNQLEAAVLNLLINSRDAMPTGGRLIISATNATLDESYTAAYDNLKAGDYIRISVRDFGIGMSPVLIEQVFEPFFSTKSAGKGSGLGLSMVLGFIKQSGGHVAVSSVVGEGTTVDLFLPRGTNINTSSEYHFTDGKEENSGELVGGSETVLIVDDESAVRETLTSLLSSLGYRTLQASSADSAIKQLITDSDVELVITDIVMPGINGFELAQQVHVCFPQIKILYCSGFATEAIMKGGNTPNINHILSKPYRISDLAHSVRRLLDDTSEQ